MANNVILPSERDYKSKILIMSSTKFLMSRKALTGLMTFFILTLSSYLEGQTLHDFNVKNPSQLTVFKGNLYFVAESETDGKELWMYDGVNEPSQLIDIYAPYQDAVLGTVNKGSNPRGLTVLEDLGLMVFTAEDATGRNIWYTDGTDFNMQFTAFNPYVSPTNPTSFNYELLFSYSLGYQGVELWSYDFVIDPEMVADLNPGSAGSYPTDFLEYQDKIYFRTQHDNEYWTLDKSGTIAPELNLSKSVFGGVVTDLIEYEGQLYFNGEKSGVKGFYAYPGSGSPVLIQDDVAPNNFYVWNGKLYFSGIYNNSTGRELLSYESGSGLIVLVKDINLGGASSNPFGFESHDGRLYFSAQGDQGNELYVLESNGNVFLAKDIAAGSLGSNPGDLTSYNGKLYFSASISLYSICGDVIYEQVAACGSHEIEGVEYTESQQVETLIQGGECEEYLYTDLTIYPEYTIDTSINFAEGQSLEFGGQNFSEYGKYELPYVTREGCDSTINLSLSIINSIEATVCNGETFTVGTDEYSVSGNYVNTFTNAEGLDSIVKLSLTVLQPIENHLRKIIQDGESYDFMGDLLTSEGTYVKTLLSESGCDSTIQLKIIKLLNGEREYLITTMNNGPGGKSLMIKMNPLKPEVLTEFTFPNSEYIGVNDIELGSDGKVYGNTSF